MSLIPVLILVFDVTAAVFAAAVVLDTYSAAFTADELDRINYSRAIKKLRS